MSSAAVSSGHLTTKVRFTNALTWFIYMGLYQYKAGLSQWHVQLPWWGI